MSLNLQDYYSQRAQLIAEDTALRADRAKLASLSDVESKAESIIRKIRKEESETVLFSMESRMLAEGIRRYGLPKTKSLNTHSQEWHFLPQKAL
jgi:hypothetical protein